MSVIAEMLTPEPRAFLGAVVVTGKHGRILELYLALYMPGLETDIEALVKDFPDLKFSTSNGNMDGCPSGLWVTINYKPRHEAWLQLAKTYTPVEVIQELDPLLQALGISHTEIAFNKHDRVVSPRTFTRFVLASPSSN